MSARAAAVERLHVDKRKLKVPPLYVHTLGDRVLRRSTKRVSKIDADLRRLAEDMLKTMYSSDGVGLAAPQVGVDKQLLAVDIDPTEASTPPLILINPVIKRYSRELAVDQEGCLSVPNIFLNVRRPLAIEVSFKDEYGRPHLLKADQLLARIIQHEMDHLSGVMFVDRIENEILLADALTKGGFSYRDVHPLRESSRSSA